MANIKGDKAIVDGMEVQKIDEFGEISVYRGTGSYGNRLYMVDKNGKALRKMDAWTAEDVGGITYVREFEFSAV